MQIARHSPSQMAGFWGILSLGLVTAILFCSSMAFRHPAWKQSSLTAWHATRIYDSSHLIDPDLVFRHGSPTDELWTGLRM